MGADITPAEAFAAGLALQLPLAFTGMMAVFNWSAFRERRNYRAAQSYRTNTTVIIVTMCALPLIPILL